MAAILSLCSIDKLTTFILQLIHGSQALSDALQSFCWPGYSSHLSIASFLPCSFAVAILGYDIFMYCFLFLMSVSGMLFLSRGFALRMFSCNLHLIAIHAGIMIHIF